MSIQKVAVIYNDRPRPETTGTYCRRALGTFADTVYLRPDQLDTAQGPFDLCVAVDDGTEWELPQNLGPTVWWAIDTHMDFQRCLRTAQQAEFVFAAQQDGARRLREAGIETAAWLPLACDPEIHRPYPVEKRYDVCFVGNLVPGPRRELVEQLQQSFPNAFVGRRYFQEMAETYSASRIVFNRSVRNDVNMRVFEALACGSLLVTNDLAGNGQADFFRDGEHLVTYAEADELIDKVGWYLEHPEVRERIAAAGRREAVTRHTYAHRMRTVLEKAERQRTLVAVESGGNQPSAGQDEGGTERGGEAAIPTDPVVSPSPPRPISHSSPVRNEEQQEPPAALFVLSTGRCGTRTLSKLLALSESIAAHHEPPPRLFEESYDAWFRVREELEDFGRMFLERKQRGLEAARAAGRIYAETSNRLTYLSPAIAAVLPEARFVHLYRHPAGVVRSGMRRRWYHGTRLDEFRIRPRPDDPAAEVWEQWDSFARCCWYWAAINRFALATVASLDPSRVLSIRFEDVIDPQSGAAESVFRFLGVECPDRDQIAAVLAAQHNAQESGDFPDFPQWPEERRRTLVEIAGPVMESLGYPADAATVADDSSHQEENQDRSDRPADGTTAGEDEQTAGNCGPSTLNSRPSTRNVQRDPAYFEFDRPEVVALVPRDARRVLDIGCGAGRLGEAVKYRQRAEVVGIEGDPQAAAAAEKPLDRVIAADLERDGFDFEDGSFDCVVCADVLEHLREPGRLLAQIRRWLAPDGCLVASIPNTRHHSVVRALLAGNWTYESAGLLDRDHVRFFTRREIQKLLFRAGFETARVRVVPGPGYREWRERGRPREVRAAGLHMTAASPDEAEEFYVYQYLLQARPAGRPGDGLTSIILVTHNELACTRQCLDSLRLRTDEPFELIVVDNGSTDGTVEYLQGLDDVRSIENADNRGFPAAANQGLRAARGENLLLLNNDTIVTTGWLRRLLDALRSDPSVGLAGPVSNNVSGPQQIPAGYQSLDELDGFAWDHGLAHHRRREATERLVGFCLLLKREVLDGIGFLDERFGIGNFEDDDFCRRAVEAGWRCVIARDAFVHHVGGRTFAGAGVDFAALMHENREKYARKWGEESRESRVEGRKTSQTPVVARSPGRATHPTAGLSNNRGDLRSEQVRGRETRAQPGESSFTVTRSTGGGLLLSKKQNGLLLSLCMIVRDNEETIAACLESIRPWVDEMIVVDTGSTDRTPAICEAYGARLFHFAWCDDFAAARNESLRHACGEWVFWMDSDDTIPEECGRKLRALVEGEHDSRTLGYVMQVHCPGADGDVTVVDHVKLFRNRPELRFEHRIHEQIIPAIRRAGGEVAFTDVYVVHSGSDQTEEGRQRKLERDFRILHRELEEKPDHPFVLFNLGMTYADVPDPRRAIRYLRRSIEVSRPEESHLRKAYALLIGAYAQSEQHEEARQTCREALELFPGDKELLFRSGTLHHHFGELDEAEAAYLRVLDEAGERHFASVDSSLAGHKARHNLALVYEDRGEPSKAAEQWEQIIANRPDYAPAWRGLGELLLTAGRYDDADSLIGRIKERESLRCEGAILQARLAECRGEPDAARRMLETALRDFPEHPEALRILCRLLFEQFGPEEAEERLQQLAACEPEDAAVHHNLGTTYFSQQRYGEATAAYQRSLTLRPRSPNTLLELGRVLWESGQPSKARECWQEGLAVAPQHADLLAALEAAAPGTTSCADAR